MNQKPGLLIDCNALRSLQEDRSCILVDTRGEPEYLEAHIPGAINLPSNDLFDMDTAGLDLLPVPEIQNTVRRVGIDQDTHLVLYDDSGLIPSARVFWVLESLGRSSMSLLNGGFPAWVASTGPTEAGRTRSDAVRGNGTPFVPLAEHGAVATRDDVLAATHEPAHLIIDARSEDEYHGRMNVHTRNGHIPTAVHLDWQDNIEDLFNPLFRPPETLRKRYTDAGSDTASQIITYCRTGSRSSHTYFTLRMLGYTNVRNYSGSWMEWSEDPSLPVETG